MATPTAASASSAPTAALWAAHQRPGELALVGVAVLRHLLLQPLHPSLGVEHALLHERHPLALLTKLRGQLFHLLLRPVQVALHCDLPVAPRHHRLLCLRGEARLQVADALRGRLAL